MGAGLHVMFKLLEEYTDKYGKYSVASLMIKYQILIESLQLAINDEGNNNCTDLLTAKELVVDHYMNTKRTPHPLKDITYASPINICNRLHLKYDKSHYEKFYYKTGLAVKKKIINLTSENEKLVYPNRFYIYIINKEGELIIYNEHIPISELVRGRTYLKYNDNSITHPLLAQDELIIRGAGEIVFSKNNQGIGGVIFNNKSGHFKPPVETNENVIESILNIFKINRNRIIDIGIKGV